MSKVSFFVSDTAALRELQVKFQVVHCAVSIITHQPGSQFTIYIFYVHHSTQLYFIQQLFF